MGSYCTCFNTNQEQNNEMVEGIIPQTILEKNSVENIEDARLKNNNNDNEENDKEENISDNNKNKPLLLNEKNQELIIQMEDEKKEEDLNSVKIDNNKTRNTLKRAVSQYSHNSSNISKIQDLNDTIFDYFNEIRTNPEDFDKLSESHGVKDIIQKFINSNTTCDNLIMNSFYNLILASYINDITCDGEDNHNMLLEQIEKEEKIKNYNKKLFVIDGDIKEPNEVIWKLIETNKETALEDFFSKNIEYLIIASKTLKDKEKFKCFLLILSKKEL